jgi:predicted nucleic acid-binding protein
MGVPVDSVAEAIRSHFEVMEVTLEPFPLRSGFDRVCQLTERFGLSSYDALYVAFAEQRGARLLTLDRAMLSAATAIGVPSVAMMGSGAN